MKTIDILSERQNHRCCYCGNGMRSVPKTKTVVPRNAATKEHIVPKSYNGLGYLENLVAACRLCNELRGNMDAIAFYNLQQKWFKKDETLRLRWHSVSAQEYRDYKLSCLDTQYRQLQGLARKCRISRHRFVWFTYHNAERLASRA